MWDINTEELIDSFQLSRTRRTIFTYSCGGSSVDFQAGCLGGMLRPFHRAYPQGCDDPEVTFPDQVCSRFESYGGITASVSVAPHDVCHSGFPFPDYANGTIVGSGSSTRRLIWVGSGAPPSMEVRVITAFKLSANAHAGGRQGCGSASVRASASARVGGSEFLGGHPMLGSSVEAGASAVDDSADSQSQTKYAISQVRVLRVQRDAQGRYYVDVPFSLDLNADVSQSPTRAYECRVSTICNIQIDNFDTARMRHPRVSGGANSKVDRLFDVFTIGNEIYLVSSTALVDGAEALACAPEFCGMRPATGQVSSSFPFPSVDTAYAGWVDTSSPAPNTTLLTGRYFGLHTVQVVIANEGTLLSDFWRAGPIQWSWWNTQNDRYDDLGDAGQFLARSQEILVYDVDGTAVRFLGRKRPDGRWVYYPAQGVFSQLSAETDASGSVVGFVLTGGAPGNMRAKGGWRYEFRPVIRSNRDVDIEITPYAPLVQVTDPLGITLTIDGDGYADIERRVNDPVSGSSLAFVGNSVRYMKGNASFNLLDSYGKDYTIPSSLSGWGDLVRMSTERLSVSHQSSGGLEEITLQNVSLFSGAGAPEIKETRGWSSISEGEQNVLGHAFQVGGTGRNYRLISRKWGDLIPTTYEYRWLDSSRYQIRTTRDTLQTWLTYTVDPNAGRFLQAQYQRPSLNGGEELFEYRFNLNGQVDRVRYFADGQTLKQETLYEFGFAADPLAVTSVTASYPQDGVTRTWSYNYTERNGETLLQSATDPTGVSVRVEYENFDYPVLPSAVVDSAGNRWEMTYTGPGLLQTFREPNRSSWQLGYYPQGHLYQNKLSQITDPTGRSVSVTVYDILGRPTRTEVSPESGRLIWQEVDWTMQGAPRTVRWSDNSRVDFYWQGPGLRAVRDARRRWVVFDYNLQQGLGAAGLLSRIRMVGQQPPEQPDTEWWSRKVSNLLEGQVFAQFTYDTLGRLRHVAGGNGVGISYTYGQRDQLTAVRHDGDSRAEEFTYSCCGQLESWIKADGRRVYFDYTAGLLTHIRLGSPTSNPAYTFSYDLAGRLKTARSSVSDHEWVYEYEQSGERYRNTGRLSEERTLLYGVGVSYTHAYSYYPSGEVETSTLVLSTTQGGFQRSLRYAYDDAGRLTNIFYNNQLLASYDYDGAGRLKSQTVYPLNTTAQLNATLTYADDQSVGALGTLHWQWNTSTLAFFDYRGFDNQPGYYPDGTLARARDQVAGQTYLWEWEYDALGQLAYEKRRVDNGEWEQTNFTYDTGGNLWGNAGWVYRFNQLVYVPRTELNNSWYFAYTPNGERWRWWTGGVLPGDVDRDGQVDDSDLLAVQFAFGRTDCPCPEDVNGDGQVDDGDLMVVLFNFGLTVNRTVSWEYTYDVWGNLVEAVSEAAGRYRALYDALGRRVGEEIIRETGSRRTYYVYEGDTIVAEVDGSGQLVAEYVWGLLGPIARIDLQNPANTRYYVIDGLGHVRALVAPNGAITEVWHYDSWGNPISPPAERIDQPFTWNGAYGYEYIPFTGLYHVGAREYDPRTARWLQRDPIDVAGGHPNVYLYCGNEPINDVDPEGLDAAYARRIVCRYRRKIIHVAKTFGLQPELLAGIVYNEAYGGRIGELISNWHEYNDALSTLKFLGGQPASLGITQITLDPRKLPGCGTFEGRARFLDNFLSDIYMQLVLAAAHLKQLIERPNRYPGRSGKLSAREMAIILTEYNIGARETSAASARPNSYGVRFMRSLKTIKDLLYGKGCQQSRQSRSGSCTGGGLIRHYYAY